MPTYYTYQGSNPSALNQPNSGVWENPADWPRAFRYVPAHDNSQGIHPPAPVFQGQGNSGPGMYYYAPASATQPAGYYMANGTYYGPTPPPMGMNYGMNTGWPFNSSPYTACSFPSMMSGYGGQYPYSYPYSQFGPAMPDPFNTTDPITAAAAAAATNAQLAARPQAPAYFVGGGQTDFAAQQAYLAQHMGYPYGGMMGGGMMGGGMMSGGMMGGMMGGMGGMPTQFAPFKPSGGQQFWCKELDGNWTLIEHGDVINGKVNPGHWEKHPMSGYLYWVKD